MPTQKKAVDINGNNEYQERDETPKEKEPNAETSEEKADMNEKKKGSMT